VAKSARRLDGTAIGINRVRIPTPPGDGSLTVLVATASGAVPGTIGDTSTDLGKVDDDIQKKAVPEGVGPVTITSATEHAVPVTCRVYVDATAGATATEVQAAIQSALSASFRMTAIGGLILPPSGGKLYRNTLLGLIEGAHAAILKGDVTLPAGDVDLSESEFASLGPLAITVMWVTP